MKTETHNGHSVTFWDSIDSLPIDRFQAFQVYLSIDAGIGGDMESVVNHITMLHKYIEADKKAEALQQLANFQQSLSFVISSLNPKHYAFACLVYSIDGKERNDISESGLKETIDILSRAKFTKGVVSKILDALKKKLLMELETCFPSLSGSGAEKDYWTQIKNRTLFALRKIQGKDTGKQIEVLDNYLLRLLTPKNFAGINGLEVKMKKDFEKLCAIISQNMGIAEPQKLTVFGFYSRLEILKNQK